MPRVKSEPTARPEDDSYLSAAEMSSAAQNDSGIVTLKELDVIVTRDAMCKISSTIYGHELPVVRFVHGTDNVEVVGSRDVRVSGFDPESEYQRLSRKYDRKNFSAMQPVYGLDGRRLAEQAGVSYQNNKPRDLIQSLVKQRPREDTVINHAA